LSGIIQSSRFLIILGSSDDDGDDDDDDDDDDLNVGVFLLLNTRNLCTRVFG
jgi:hypothetical protein